LCVVETGNAVPALFDAKKNSIVNSLREGFLLRDKIQASVIQMDDALVFDALGIRQRFLAWPLRVETIAQGMGNIYLAYARYLGFTEDYINTVRRNGAKPGECVYIFPDSRLKYKDLPSHLIIDIAQENFNRGKKTILVKVGKPVTLPQFDSIQILWIEGLDQLVTQIQKADLMVSADSLPSHLAEYLDVPVFVFTPITNGYWVPLSSYNNGFFSGFNSLTRYKEWLDNV
jgi:hypothetical protein